MTRTLLPAFSALLLLAMTTSAPGQAAPAAAPATAATTPPAKPNPRDARIAETVRFGGTDAKPLTLDYYKPKGAGPHPAVVIVHGGGFVGGTSRNGSEAYVADFVTPAGYAAFSVNYRLAPGATFADMVADVQRSIRFVRHNAAKYDVDPEKMVLVGGSAGGYLSNMVGLSPYTQGTGDAVDRESDKLAAVVTLYGICCLNEWPSAEFVKNGLYGDLPPTAATALAASPISQVRADAPPFLLIHGDTDESVPFAQSMQLAHALARAGVRVELIPIPLGRHGTYQWTMPNIPNWELEMTEWLNDTLHHTGPIGEGIVRKPATP
jgi:acetyl esterase